MNHNNDDCFDFFVTYDPQPYITNQNIEYEPDHVPTDHNNYPLTAESTEISKIEQKIMIPNSNHVKVSELKEIPIIARAAEKFKNVRIKKPKQKKKAKKLKRTLSIKNLVKNYLPITCNVFTHKLVEGKDLIIKRLLAAIVERKALELDMDPKDLEKQILDYVEEYLFGKKDEKSKNGSESTRQYKVRSKKNIEDFFHEKETDNEPIKIIKLMLRDLISEFFRSESFSGWVLNEYKAKHEENRQFFLNKINIENIIQAYQEPGKRRRFA